MDFDLSDEQIRCRDTFGRFAAVHLSPEALPTATPKRGFSRAAWVRCAEAGVLALPVPEAYGGRGVDPLTIVLVMEALGYHCRDNGLLFSLNAHLWSCVEPLLSFGTEDQKRRYLPPLCDGSLIGAQAITEPGSGSDAFGMSTVATRRGDAWVLNGAKTFITNAPVADLFIVFATSDRAQGLDGLCALLVERGDPGLMTTPPMPKIGLHGSATGEIVLSDCVVPAGRTLGRPGAAMAVFLAAMDWERSFIMASALGTMEHQFDCCVGALRQGGGVIPRLQANRLANMRIRIDVARLLLYRQARSKSQRRRGTYGPALTKLALSESFLASCLDASHLAPGACLGDDGWSRDLNDALAGRIYSGTSEMQREVIGRWMGL